MEILIFNSMSLSLNILLKPLKLSLTTLSLLLFNKNQLLIKLKFLDNNNKSNNNKLLPLDKLFNNKQCNSKLNNNNNNNNTNMEVMLLIINSFLNNNMLLLCMDNNKWWWILKCSNKMMLWTWMNMLVNIDSLKLKKENQVKKELISKKPNGLDPMNGYKKLKETRT